MRIRDTITYIVCETNNSIKWHEIEHPFMQKMNMHPDSQKSRIGFFRLIIDYSKNAVPRIIDIFLLAQLSHW